MKNFSHAKLYAVTAILMAALLLFTPQHNVAASMLETFMHNTLDLVSINGSGTKTNAAVNTIAINADGQYVAFDTTSGVLVTGVGNGSRQVFVKDVSNGTLEHVSKSGSGTVGNGNSTDPSLSADGQFVAFLSQATNLVTGDTNGTQDIFVYDRHLDTVLLASTASDGTLANGSAYDTPRMCGNGSHVVFSSSANNLVAEDTNGQQDVFIKNLSTGFVQLVSTAADDTQGNGKSDRPDVSADCRFITFRSAATNLIGSDTNGKYDIFRKDLNTGTTTLVSSTSSGLQVSQNSLYASISDDGQKVAFSSNASDLAAGDSNGVGDVFVKDMTNNAVTLISLSTSGGTGNGESFEPFISGDGRYVTYYSAASDLVAGDTNGTWDVFVHDLQDSTTELVSHHTDGTPGNSVSFYPTISNEGSSVAFISYASNLHDNDLDSTADAYIVAYDDPTLDDFIITVKTDNDGYSEDNQFKFFTEGSGFNYNVDCDNDGLNEVIGHTLFGYTCTYDTPGTYTIRIQDNAGDGTGFPRFYMLPESSGFDPKKLLSVEQWGTMKWTSMESAFRDCINLSINASDAPDLSNVTSMYNMFTNSGLTTENLSNWDTSNVTEFTQMFGGATHFNGDITTWDTSNATNMSWMFLTAFDFNQDISGWDTGNVTNMATMFNGATSFNQDISGWDTSKVTNMHGTFKYALAFDQDLSSWDMSSVTDAEFMFDDIKLSTPNYDAMLIAWNGQSLKTGVNFGGGKSKYCFAETARANMIDPAGHNWTIDDKGKDCSAYPDDFVITVDALSFTVPTTGGVTYNYNIDCDNDGNYEATGQTGTFTCNYTVKVPHTIRIQDNTGDGSGFARIYFNGGTEATKLESVDQWGTMKWSSMAYAFDGCSNLVINATDAPDLSGVTSLEGMFWNASSFNQSISHWNTSTITTMENMFTNADSMTDAAGVSNWDVSNVTTMEAMFSGADNFNENISGWDVSSVTDMEDMFQSADAFNQDIRGWDVYNVTSMKQMFESADSFNQDISSWDTSAVTDMNNMFNYAIAFNQDLSNWDTGAVTDMTDMFAYASSFDQDLSGWDVSSLTTADSMFEGIALSTVNYDALLNGWNAQTLQSGVTFDGGNSNYCNAETARQNMISSDGWTITDGGKLCPQLETPTLVSPEDGTTVYSIYPTFEWSEVTGATSYTLEYSDEDTFAAPGSEITTNTSIAVYDLPLGTLYWRVKATGDNPDSEWSSIWSFTVAQPLAPTLIAPADESISSNLYPTFEWAEVDGALAYTIQYSQDQTFGVKITDAWLSETSTTQGLNPGTWYWRVKAEGEPDSEWSEVWSHTITGDTLNTPTLISPEDGYTTSDSYPSFHWSSVTDTNYYNLVFSQTYPFTSPTVVVCYDTTCEPTHELPDGTWYWMVQAVGTHQNSAWSDVWSLSINSSAPTIRGPIDGTVTSDHTPNFDWDDVTDATSYVIQVSPDEDFTRKPINHTVTKSFFAPGISMINQQYWWRVIAIVDGSLTDWSEVRTITITGAPGNAAPVAVSPENGVTTSDRTPTFSWTEVATAVRYRIQISPLEGFGIWVVNQTIDAPTTSWTPGMSFNPGTYWWRVQAEGGGDSSWFSVKRSLTITSP